MSDCFVMIPVQMIKEVMVNTNGIDVILCYGLYHSARKQKTDIESFEPLRQLMYCYHRNTKAITPSLSQQLEERIEAGDICIDEVYNGFNGPEFNPELEMEGLCQLVQNDKELKEEIWEWYDMLQFYKLAELVQNGNAIAQTIAVAKRYGRFDGEPYAMISTHLLITLRDKFRTEKDRAALAMLLSICSIIGKKNFAATTKKHIIYRMFGSKNEEGLKENLCSKPLKACHQKYTTRKVFDNLRDELFKRSLLKCYHGHAGRVYVSNKFCFQELIDDIADFIRKNTHPVPSWKSNENELMKKLTNVSKGTP